MKTIEDTLSRAAVEIIINKAKESGAVTTVFVVIDVEPRHEVYIRYLDKFCTLEGNKCYYTADRDRISAESNNTRAIRLEKPDVWVYDNYFFAFARAYKISARNPIFTKG